MARIDVYEMYALYDKHHKVFSFIKKKVETQTWYIVTLLVRSMHLISVQSRP